MEPPPWTSRAEPQHGVFAPAPKPRKVLRYFHVVNVFVEGGGEHASSPLVLLEATRSATDPPAHWQRMRPLSSKFAPEQLGHSPLVPDAHVVAARQCVVRRLRLGGTSRIVVDSSSYCTEHVRSRRTAVPNLTAIFIVHRLTARVEPPLCPRSFAVRHESYDVRAASGPPVLPPHRLTAPPPRRPAAPACSCAGLVSPIEFAPPSPLNPPPLSCPPCSCALASPPSSGGPALSWRRCWRSGGQR